MTEIKPNIHQRINAIMAKIDYVKKGDKKVNNQYTFVSHDDVTAKLHPECVANGINIIPTVTESSIEWTEYTQYDTYKKVDVIKFRGFTRALVDVAFVNIDDPQDVVTVSQVGYGIDEQDKGIGKAVSYACKYAMLKVFMLETGDDPEKDLIEHKPADKKSWKGPLNKTTLDKQIKEYISRVYEADSAEEIDELFKEYHAEIEQAKIDTPTAIYGQGDIKGAAKEVKERKANLAQLENQLKQPE